MIRHIRRAMIFSLFLSAVYVYIIPILSGMILTYFYVPDITSAYQSVKVLQNEVSFGDIYPSSFSDLQFWLQIMLYFIIGICIYFVFLFISRVRKRM